MTPKWTQNAAQSGPRGSRSSKKHAEIKKTRPEALHPGTLVAFWRKNGAQGGPKRSQENTKIFENLKKRLSMSKSIFESRFFMVFHGFLVDFDEKKETKLACVEQSLNHVSRRSFSTLF